MPETVMTPSAFKHWRKSLGLSQKEAAEALGLKRRVVQYYEKGERDGDPVAIPRTVRLACWALMQGTTDYAGPVSGEGEAAARSRKDAGKDPEGGRGSRKKAKAARREGEAAGEGVADGADAPSPSVPEREPGAAPAPETPLPS
ncbi:helix-turn-helix domain-containing protein [Pararhodospirillum oryzae]|uniref:HTH cro/C1-type domain-containing protein n=1 Tax=Pararhodospirillum oryzae TaxID=478448 RepID=A0A512HBT3_9PROT|nr:helix-turn-helix transcriptional regulator [Pararhodospirillum oryzae]GEO82909.1 hypothetical protein ROR02_30400 [Pararhodospirillum oryzae]